jgi:hypothetical protein
LPIFQFGESPDISLEPDITLQIGALVVQRLAILTFEEENLNLIRILRGAFD